MIYGFLTFALEVFLFFLLLLFFHTKIKEVRSDVINIAKKEGTKVKNKAYQTFTGHTENENSTHVKK